MATLGGIDDSGSRYRVRVHHPRCDLFGNTRCRGVTIPLDGNTAGSWTDDLFAISTG